MRELARQLQAQGRGEDSILIHMTPGEVKGLQALAMAHGGTLTVNPTTGLPEAGFLSKILPTLLGVGLSFISGGALTPLMTAGLVGAGTGLATGSLEKGLMAGLGAFGGASLGTALGAGTGQGFLGGIGDKVSNVLGGGATPAVTTAAPATASSYATGTAKMLGDTALPGELASGVGRVAPVVPATASSYATGTAKMLGDTALPGELAASGTGAGAQAPGVFNRLVAGSYGVGPDATPAELAKYGFGEGQTVGLRGYGALGGLALPLFQQEPGKGPKEEEEYSPISEYRPLPPRQVSYPGPGYGSREYNYFNPSTYPFAEGGEATAEKQPKELGALTRAGVERDYGFRGPSAAAALAAAPTTTNRNPAMGGKGGKAGRIADMQRLKEEAKTQPGYAAAAEKYNNPLAQRFYQGRFVDNYVKQNLREGGEVHLKDGSFILDARTVSELGNGSSGAGQERLARIGGRPIQGPGDGVSDSIRANIGGRQDARIARDEVMFSPEAVRRIGRGDERRGAQKLYRLMDKAHHERRSVKRGEPSKGLGALLK